MRHAPIDMLASLGINPLLAAIITLWALSYVIALRLLIERYRRTKGVAVGFWLPVALFIPAGQVFAIIYLCQRRRRKLIGNLDKD